MWRGCWRPPVEGLQNTTVEGLQNTTVEGLQKTTVEREAAEDHLRRGCWPLFNHHTEWVPNCTRMSYKKETMNARREFIF
jgi:hypothetical protein